MTSLKLNNPSSPVKGAPAVRPGSSPSVHPSGPRNGTPREAAVSPGSRTTSSKKLGADGKAERMAAKLNKSLGVAEKKPSFRQPSREASFKTDMKDLLKSEKQKERELKKRATVNDTKAKDPAPKVAAPTTAKSNTSSKDVTAKAKEPSKPLKPKTAPSEKLQEGVTKKPSFSAMAPAWKDVSSEAGPNSTASKSGAKETNTPDHAENTDAAPVADRVTSPQATDQELGNKAKEEEEKVAIVDDKNSEEAEARIEEEYLAADAAAEVAEMEADAAAVAIADAKEAELEAEGKAEEAAAHRDSRLQAAAALVASLEAKKAETAAARASEKKARRAARAARGSGDDAAEQIQLAAPSLQPKKRVPPPRKSKIDVSQSSEGVLVKDISVEDATQAEGTASNVVVSVEVVSEEDKSVAGIASEDNEASAAKNDATCNELPGFGANEDSANVLQSAVNTLTAEAQPSLQVHFESITALRRVLKAHPDLLRQDGSLLPKLLPSIQQACRHSQSSLSRNSLLLVGELFATEPPLLQTSIDKAAIASLVAACLTQCSESQPNSITRHAAFDAVEQLTRKWNSADMSGLLVSTALAYIELKYKIGVPVLGNESSGGATTQDPAVTDDQTQKGGGNLGEALGLLCASIHGPVLVHKSALKLSCLALAQCAGEVEYQAAQKAIDSLAQVRNGQGRESDATVSTNSQASPDEITGANHRKALKDGKQVDGETPSKKYPMGYAVVADLGFVPKAKPSLKPRLMGSFSLKPTSIRGKKKKGADDSVMPGNKVERPSARRGDLEVSELQRLTAQKAAAAKEEEDAEHRTNGTNGTEEGASNATESKENNNSDGGSNKGSFSNSVQGSMQGTSFESTCADGSTSAGGAGSPTSLSKRELGKEKLAAKKAAKAAAEEAKKVAQRQAEADKKVELATRVSAASGVQRLSPSELRKGPMSFLPDKLAPWRSNGAEQLNKERLLAKHKARLMDLKQAVEAAKIRVKEAKVTVKKAAKGAPKEMAKVALLEAQQSVKDAQEAEKKAKKGGVGGAEAEANKRKAEKEAAREAALMAEARAEIDREKALEAERIRAEEQAAAEARTAAEAAEAARVGAIKAERAAALEAKARKLAEEVQAKGEANAVAAKEAAEAQATDVAAAALAAAQEAAGAAEAAAAAQVEQDAKDEAAIVASESEVDAAQEQEWQASEAKEASTAAKSVEALERSGKAEAAASARRQAKAAAAERRAAHAAAVAKTNEARAEAAEARKQARSARAEEVAAGVAAQTKATAASVAQAAADEAQAAVERATAAEVALAAEVKRVLDEGAAAAAAVMAASFKEDGEEEAKDDDKADKSGEIGASVPSAEEVDDAVGEKSNDVPSEASVDLDANLSPTTTCSGTDDVAASVALDVEEFAFPEHETSAETDAQPIVDELNSVPALESGSMPAGTEI